MFILLPLLEESAGKSREVELFRRGGDILYAASWQPENFFIADVGHAQGACTHVACLQKNPNTFISTCLSISWTTVDEGRRRIVAAFVFITVHMVQEILSDSEGDEELQAPVMHQMPSHQKAQLQH